MIRSKTEILESIRAIVGENTDDTVISILEDAEDTFTDLETKAAPDPDAIDWKTKYEENDSAWRKRYKERFFSGEPEIIDQPDDELEDVGEGPTRFEELFS